MLRQCVLVFLVASCVVAWPAASLGGNDAGWISLFDGTSLKGWRANKNPKSFKVENGTVIAHGERSYLLYFGDGKSKADFENFEFEAEVMTRPGANSGVLFHTAFQKADVLDQGFEVQINGSPVPQGTHGRYLETKKTGSLYGVRSIYKTMHQDNAWFRLHVAVRGGHVQVRINDVVVVDYIEPDMPGSSRHRRLSRGRFALQAHDPQSWVAFRNIRVRPLPDDLADPSRPAPFDDLAKQIVQLTGQNFPVIDLHTHLTGGLSLGYVLEHMHRTGINHGVVAVGGSGCPISDDKDIEQLFRAMKDVPCFIGFQGQGREWPKLFSKQALSKFDYVLTDSMTIADPQGKPTRLWIKEEVDIPDEQAFMDHLVTTIVKIIEEEPIDIYANPTYLPDVIAPEYDALWTPDRTDRVIAAAVKKGVAIEINSRLKIPNPEFIKRAQRAGVKFTLGTDNTDRNLGRLEYSFQQVKDCGLSWRDMWMPKMNRKQAKGVGATRPASTEGD